MNYPSINIQGNIISSEVIDKIRNDDDFKHQQANAFGFEKNIKVRDEIGLAWSTARSFWQAFKLKMGRVDDEKSGTSETRSLWVLPLLSALGYDMEIGRAEMVNDKSFAISHRAVNLKGFPVHIMGINDNLDKRRETGGPRLSPHALAQEYVNSTDHVYALVTNGRYLRLLRDATRLVRLSYLEFNLEKMMEEELYADFAALFRLLHATRMPKQPDQAAESYIEYYHQESLASGSRIREKLSEAVECSIKELANGFLKHSDNEATIKRETEIAGTGEKRIDAISLGDKTMEPGDYYLYQLRLIYRLLFLIVTEERNLVYPETKDEEIQWKRKLYYDYYSIERLRKLAAKADYVDGRKHDLWEGLNTTFMLFEKSFYGEKLGIKPLGSGLFSPSALGNLPNLKLDNETLLRVIRHLTLFNNEQGRWVRVNYSDLDVEEFGSVYEGLLEFDATFINKGGMPHFAFVEGTGRSSSGSHYTPEELVKPLIKHSLEYVIEGKLKKPNKEAALLSIKVCDIACGSGHILLSAARRIATELARVRTNEDQPTPSAMRQAIRDVIKNCIYGVDKNPLAVELCKVALWLEAHNPGEPLNFLDHHIKCGDAIVGLAHKEELQRGIANEAFKALPGDDKELARAYAKRNKAERDMRGQAVLDFEGNIGKGLNNVLQEFQKFSQLPETTPEEIEKKSAAYNKLIHSGTLQRLKTLADLQVAQFFIPKTSANKGYLVTDANYFQYLKGAKAVPTTIESKTIALTAEKRFFHWFLEFPEVFQQGGFNCILGNPPFLGGTKISTFYGNSFQNYLGTSFVESGGLSDLVSYFFRRAFLVIKENSFLGLISTNSISQGDSRKTSLEYFINNGCAINFAMPNIKWPGVAAVEVSLICIVKGKFLNKPLLRGKPVDVITSYLDDIVVLGEPYKLQQNEDKSFIGSSINAIGFVLEINEASKLLEKNSRNSHVVFPFLSGKDINDHPAQSPGRSIINFLDWPLEKADSYVECMEIVTQRVKPQRLAENSGNSTALDVAKRWWQFKRPTIDLYKRVRTLDRILCSARVSKYTYPVFIPSNYVYMDKILIYPSSDEWQFSLLCSSFYEQWVWKHSSTLGSSTVNNSPSESFETYPFPNITSIGRSLGLIGENYHDHRQKLMLQIQLGLTKTYNLFHSNTLRAVIPSEAILEDKAFEKLVGKEGAQLRKHLAKTPGTIFFNEAVTGIEKLRELHVQMDEVVLEAYAWQDIQLRHDFYEVDYLPENDRIRYTIHPDARKEVLKRLLELNHQIHEEEVKAGLWDKKGGKAKESKKAGKTTKAVTPEAAPLFEQLAKDTAPVSAVKEGSRVVFRDVDGKDHRVWLKPNAVKDKVSHDGFREVLSATPLAQAMIGKKKGECFTFGPNKWTIQDVV